MKETWKTINSVIGRGKKLIQPDKFKSDTEVNISEPAKISNEFNDFFVNIGPKLASKIQHSGKDYYEYLTRKKLSKL